MIESVKNIHTYIVVKIYLIILRLKQLLSVSNIHFDVFVYVILGNNNKKSLLITLNHIVHKSAINTSFGQIK
jgi:hypothetical protein